MSQFLVNILVQARDQASGELNRVGNLLQRIQRIAVGVVTSRILFGIAKGFRELTSAAFEAIEVYDRASAALEALIARELIRTQVVSDLNTAMRYGVPLLESEVTNSQKLAYAFELAAGPAQELFKWIQELALISPFKEKDVIEAFRVAAAYGFATQYGGALVNETERLKLAQEEGVVTAQRLTQALLDFAAATGLEGLKLSNVVRALGQIKAKGKLAAEEIRQLVNAGLGIDVMADAMGLTTDEFIRLQKEGSILAEDFLPALIAFIENTLSGASARFLETFTGIKEALGELAVVLLRRFLQPITNMLVPAMRELFAMGSAPAVFDAVTQWGERAGAVAEVVATKIIQLLGLLKELNTLSAFEIRVKFIGIVFGDEALEKINDLTDAIDDFGERIGFVEGGLKALEGFFTGFGRVLLGARVAGAIRFIMRLLLGFLFSNPILKAIAFGVGLLRAAWDGNWLGMRDTLTEIWEGGVRDKLIEIWEWFSKTLPQGLKDFFEPFLNEWLPKLQEFLSSTFGGANTGQGFQAFLEWFLNLELPTASEITEFLNGIVTNVRELGEALTEFKQEGIKKFEEFLDLIDRIVQYKAETIDPAVTSIIDFLEGVVKNLPEINVNVSGFTQFVKDLKEMFSKNIVSNAEAFGTYVTPILSGIGDVIKVISDFLTTEFVNNWRYFWSSTKKEHASTWALMVEVVDAMGESFGALWDVVQKLVDIIGKMINITFMQFAVIWYGLLQPLLLVFLGIMDKLGFNTEFVRSGFASITDLIIGAEITWHNFYQGVLTLIIIGFEKLTGWLEKVAELLDTISSALDSIEPPQWLKDLLGLSSSGGGGGGFGGSTGGGGGPGIPGSTSSVPVPATVAGGFIPQTINIFYTPEAARAGLAMQEFLALQRRNEVMG